MVERPRISDAPLAVEVVARHSDSYPVNVRALAADLGLTIATVSLDDNISGKIERDPSKAGEFLISVNRNHSDVRQRFTIAHEIAHYILHRDLIGDGIVDDGLYRDGRLGDERERQANRYAARILMPRKLVENAWGRGHRSAALLAADFQVSEAVAAIRMRELGCALWANDDQMTLL